MSPYKILGVSPEMSLDEAKKSYRSLCKKYHPDGSNGDVVKFKEIQEAWEILSTSKNAFGVKKLTPTHRSLFKIRRI